MEKFVCLLLSTNENYLLESSLFLNIQDFIGTEYEQLKVYLLNTRISQDFRNLCLELYKEFGKQYKVKFSIEGENQVKLNFTIYRSIFKIKNDWKIIIEQKERIGNWSYIACCYEITNFYSSDKYSVSFCGFFDNIKKNLFDWVKYKLNF